MPRKNHETMKEIGHSMTVQCHSATVAGYSLTTFLEKAASLQQNLHTQNQKTLQNQSDVTSKKQIYKN
jgi:hypothetical protein